MRVLVISVHPDDETLGCGGTILKHRMAGDSICWLIVTQAHEPRWSRETIQRKAIEVEKVTSAYDFERVITLKMPTTQLDTLPHGELMVRISEAISEARPECVYLIHGGDIHTDHRIVFETTMGVLKPFYSGRHKVRRILCYETLSSTEAIPPNVARVFVPTVFHDITPFMEQKLEIMSLYASEAQPYPMPRASESIRALARFRGAVVGLEYAEAFSLMRELL